VRRGVFFDHQGEVEIVASLRGHGDTDQATTEPRHEVDGLRGHHVSGKDQVPFVLAVLVIDDDDLLATADTPNGLFGGNEDIARYL